MLVPAVHAVCIRWPAFVAIVRFAAGPAFIDRLTAYAVANVLGMWAPAPALALPVVTASVAGITAEFRAGLPD